VVPGGLGVEVILFDLLDPVIGLQLQRLGLHHLEEGVTARAASDLTDQHATLKVELGTAGGT
jgi:hypothetical protein